jgi:hypothetical protein
VRKEKKGEKWGIKQKKRKDKSELTNKVTRELKEATRDKVQIF